LVSASPRGLRSAALMDWGFIPAKALRPPLRLRRPDFREEGAFWGPCTCQTSEKAGRNMMEMTDGARGRQSQHNALVYSYWQKLESINYNGSLKTPKSSSKDTIDNKCIFHRVSFATRLLLASGLKGGGALALSPMPGKEHTCGG